MISRYDIEKAKRDLSKKLETCDESEVLFLTELKAVIEGMQEICLEVFDEREKEKASAATEARDKLYCLDFDDLKQDIVLSFSTVAKECCEKYNNVSWSTSGSFGSNPRLSARVVDTRNKKKSFSVDVEFYSKQSLKEVLKK